MSKTTNTSTVTQRMKSILSKWDNEGDNRAIFLRCYHMMTENMLVAIDRTEFEDPAWVTNLLERFADYYFVATEAYDAQPEDASTVWQMAHECACGEDLNPLQRLLVGVNAHINYDLVLTLYDVLHDSWNDLPEDLRDQRYRDHCKVNEIIGRTIDRVQDEIIAPSMPVMKRIDKWLGPVDELAISGLISHWREEVWKNTTKLLEEPDAGRRRKIISSVEKATLKKGKMLAF